ncbi:tetratricopeptide repeat-containing sensor histidine kinase [Flavitalea flava]
MKGYCMKVGLGLILLLLSGKSFTQSMEIAAIKETILEREQTAGFQQDTSYIDHLNSMAHAYYGINADSAFSFAKKALKYAEKSGYRKGESLSWRMIGNTYEFIGDYLNMLSSYHKSLDIAESIGNSRLIALANLNIALFYDQMEEYDEALSRMTKVSEVYKKNGDSIQLENLLSHQSEISFRQKQYDKALGYSNQALQIAMTMRDSSIVADIRNDIGSILAVKGKFQESLDFHVKAMDYYSRAGVKLGQTETSNFLSRTYLLLKDYPKALQFGRQGLSLARELKRSKEIRDAGKVLSEVYEAKGDPRSALIYFKLYKDFSDSLFNETNRRKTFALEAKYEYERKEALMKEDASEKEALHQHIVRNHALQIFIAVIAIVFLSIVTFILFRSRADKQRANQLLQTKNLEISRQKEEMEHQAVQLLLNNQQKDKLFSIIAHDLRGPLNSLKGLLDFLKEKSLPESEIRNMMAELKRNVDYSADLVSNLLFWASSQLDGLVVNPVDLPVLPLVQETLALFSKQISDKKIVVQTEISSTWVAYADKDMIQVVVRNLLSNAIKFCRSGDSIFITGAVNDVFIEICVADSGIGIKADVLEKINRNESVTTYGTAKEKGTGLGMLLCREFTEKNNGRFWIKSSWGEGSRFYFAIPVAASSSSISV